MQPAQLSLLPDQTPAPPTLLAHLPEAQVASAIIEFARLIANAATATRGEVDDD
jgi:hypothetical protein